MIMALKRRLRFILIISIAFIATVILFTSTLWVTFFQRKSQSVYDFFMPELDQKVYDMERSKDETFKLDYAKLSLLERIRMLPKYRQMSELVKDYKVEKYHNPLLPLSLFKTPGAFSARYLGFTRKEIDEFIELACDQRGNEELKELCRPMMLKPIMIVGDFNDVSDKSNGRSPSKTLKQYTDAPINEIILKEWLVNDLLRLDPMLKTVFEERQFNGSLLGDLLSRPETLKLFQRFDRVISLNEYMLNGFNCKANWFIKESQVGAVLSLLNVYLLQDPEEKLKVLHVTRNGLSLTKSSSFSHSMDDISNTIDSEAKKHLESAIQLAFDKTSPLPLPAHEKAYYENLSKFPEEWLVNIYRIKLWEQKNLIIKAFSESVDYFHIKMEHFCKDKQKYVMSLKQHFALDHIETTNLLKSLSSDDECTRLSDDNNVDNTDGVLTYLMKLIANEGLSAFDYETTTRNTIQNEMIRLISRVRKLGNDKVIMTLVTKGFESTFENWMLFLEEALGVSQHQTPFTVVVLTNDASVQTYLQNREYKLAKSIEILAYSIENVSHLQDISSVWKIRMEYGNYLLNAGFTLMFCDLDALFFKHPFSLDTISKYDVTASRGIFPEKISNLWGGTICMGHVIFKPTEFSKKLLKDSMHLVEIYGDDQVAINYALNRTISRDPDLSNTLLGPSNSLDEKKGSYITYKDKVVILPYDIIPRYCVQDFRRFVNSTTKTPAASNWVSQLYPNAEVVHCYTANRGKEKEAFWKLYHLWKVPDSFGS